MIHPDLIAYIKQCREEHIEDHEIVKNLTSAGWNRDTIDDALRLSTQPSVPIPPLSETKQLQSTTRNVPQNSMWDAFEHILMFISLYVMACSIAFILYYFVDKWFPGITVDMAYRGRNAQVENLRRSLAALVVSYPLFSFFFLRVTKATLANPQIRNLKARKFLIYFTLVITFIIMVSNVIQIVFNFLNGNITLNFVLNFVITIIISGIIFTYYLTQIKEDRKIYG